MLPNCRCVDESVHGCPPNPRRPVQIPHPTARPRFFAVLQVSCLNLPKLLFFWQSRLTASFLLKLGIDAFFGVVIGANCAALVSGFSPARVPCGRLSRSPGSSSRFQNSGLRPHPRPAQLGHASRLGRRLDQTPATPGAPPRTLLVAQHGSILLDRPAFVAARWDQRLSQTQLLGVKPRRLAQISRTIDPSAAALGRSKAARHGSARAVAVFGFRVSASL